MGPRVDPLGPRGIHPGTSMDASWTQDGSPWSQRIPPWFLSVPPWSQRVPSVPKGPHQSKRFPLVHAGLRRGAGGGLGGGRRRATGGAGGPEKRKHQIEKHLAGSHQVIALGPCKRIVWQYKTVIIVPNRVLLQAQLYLPIKSLLCCFRRCQFFFAVLPDSFFIVS